MPRQAELIERLRAMLAGQRTREVSMFGSRAFLVNDKIVAGALRAGDLLVRVDGARDGELAGRPGAARARMGPGRVMGPGWLEVSAVSIADDADLAFWLDIALEHNRAAAR